jgi:outer membrane receptor protein involved in Fe transport
LGLGLAEKPGGWSSFTGNRALARFDAERLLSGELGWTTHNASQSLQLAANLFYYSIDDYQIERSFSPTDYLVVNAPRARSFGGEIEAQWRPVGQWHFTASVGFTSITLREFSDPSDGTDYSGNRAPYAPAGTAALGADWQSGKGWFARAEIVTMGSIYYDETEQTSSRTPARTLVELAAGFERGSWRFVVAATNLFDRPYYALLIPGVGHGVPGAPRQVASTLTWRW